jgi:hypothetical protein
MSTSNPPLLPEVKIGARQTDQHDLDLTSAGVQRYLWQGAYGAMLIEVRVARSSSTVTALHRSRKCTDMHDDGSLRPLR